MPRSAVLLVFAAISASMIPAAASECTSRVNIAASRARWALVRNQPAHSADKEKSCRAYAASFYESVALRQATAMCVQDADHERNLAVLDSEIDSFNNLLAAKCGS